MRRTAPYPIVMDFVRDIEKARTLRTASARAIAQRRAANAWSSMTARAQTQVLDHADPDFLRRFFERERGDY